MTEYRAEGLCRPADSLTLEELQSACETGEILQSIALAFDTQHRLHFKLAGYPAMMPFESSADGAETGTVRDVAILTRVGHPTCFVIEQITFDDENNPVFQLSRAKAQHSCRTEYLDHLQMGQIIPCTVTHIDSFGAFCDVGCGISALLPIDCLSVSRISSPADRIRAGQQLLCAVKSRDLQGRLVLTLKELMGTWQENAEMFHPGDTVVGIVRSVEEYGVFIEIAPNLAGLAEAEEELIPGQPVSVYIKNILPAKMKVKLAVVNSRLEQPIRFEPHYFVKQGRLTHWVYSTPDCTKRIETLFE